MANKYYNELLVRIDNTLGLIAFAYQQTGIADDWMVCSYTSLYWKLQRVLAFGSAVDRGKALDILVTYYCPTITQMTNDN